MSNRAGNRARGAPVGVALLGFALSAHAAADMIDALPDPTRPYHGTDAPRGEPAAGRQPRLDLQSILIAPGRKSAVINGRIAAVGARVAGATVVNIAPEQVVVRRDGRTITLRLMPAQVVVRTGAHEAGHD